MVSKVGKVMKNGVHVFGQSLGRNLSMEIEVDFFQKAKVNVRFRVTSNSG